MSIQDVVDALNEGSSLEEILHLITEYNIDINESVGELRLRAIHHSVFKDRLDCVKLFLSHGCDINARDQCGFTPLHIAARYNKADMANELITLGAQIDAEDSLGCAPLHHALQKGHFKCSEVLLQHGAEPNAYYKTIGYEIHALPGVYSDCLELLLSYGADPDVRDTQGFVPLHHATRARNKLYVYILLKNGADPDVRTQTTIPEYGLMGKTSLQLAVFTHDCKSIIELLLLYGADPNCKDDHGNTPLHHAAGRGNIEIAKILIEHGAILTVRNTLRYHPLHSACGSGATPEMIKLLLANGAFINSTTSLQETPVKCLLSYWQETNDGMNTNSHGEEGLLKERDEQCVQQILCLLDYGARITVSTLLYDPFSVLKMMPAILRMKQTRYLLLEASVDTRLLDPMGIIPVKYTTTEFQDVLSRATNPISLRQACRRIIRKALGKTNLEEAVTELQIPAILQSFLTFRTY